MKQILGPINLGLYPKYKFLGKPPKGSLPVLSVHAFPVPDKLITPILEIALEEAHSHDQIVKQKCARDGDVSRGLIPKGASIHGMIVEIQKWGGV